MLQATRWRRPRARPSATLSEVTEVVNNEDTKMRRPLDTAFRQQRMPALVLILTPWNIVATFCVLGLICIGIGVPLIFAASSIEQTKTQYDGIGTDSK
jgi:hypothetical protein